MAGLGFYLFIVHMFTAEKPFITPAVFKDRNLSAGTAGDVRGGHGAAGGIGVAGAVAAGSGQLSGGDSGAGDGSARLRHDGGDDDRRAAVEQGRCASADGVRYRRPVLEPVPDDRLDPGRFGITMVVNNDRCKGAGLGFVFIPLQVIAFATLDPALRTEGTALLSLLRNIGSAIGISVTSALVTQNSRSSIRCCPAISRH